MSPRYVFCLHCQTRTEKSEIEKCIGGLAAKRKIHIFKAVKTHCGPEMRGKCQASFHNYTFFFFFSSVTPFLENCALKILDKKIFFQEVTTKEQSRFIEMSLRHLLVCFCVCYLKMST